MAVKAKNVLKDDPLGLKLITLELGASATGQTDLEKDAIVPGFAGRVVAVQVYAKTVTAAITCMVRKGTTALLSGAVTPVADTPTNGTLVTTESTLRFSATDELNLIYTSDGNGAATNMRARVWVRPYPMNGEA